eukprot:TRINITY_DN25183_c0_g1_i1.p1 TRINITY_DN25183_c0_g1~~TRINITY_DN25183_c0_g1_i1.p1  ORF type:complete len:419 (+),score=98.67 TRINITY_DN25183_c0_g1_i1:67-1323(+)
MNEIDPHDGYELVHWMGDGGTKGMWVGTGLREGKTGSHVARSVARRKTKMKKWRNILKKESQPGSNGKVVQPEPIDLAGGVFQKTAVCPQGITLTCYITGQTLALAEIQRCSKIREDLMIKCLTDAGVSEFAIEFEPPRAKPPDITVEDLQGPHADACEHAIEVYNEEAQQCYLQSMQDVLHWASENMRDGADKVNKAVLDAMPSIRHTSSKMAQEPPLVIFPFPSSFEERKSTFQKMGANKKGELDVEKCQVAASKIDSEFDHSSAVVRAFRLADKTKTGTLSLNEAESECEFAHYLKYLEKYTIMLRKVGERFKGRTFESSEWERLAPGVISDDRIPPSQVTEMFNDLDVDKTGLVEVHEIIMFAAKVAGDIEVSSEAPRWVSPARSASWREAVADWGTTAVEAPTIVPNGNIPEG